MSDSGVARFSAYDIEGNRIRHATLSTQRRRGLASRALVDIRNEYAGAAPYQTLGERAAESTGTACDNDCAPIDGEEWGSPWPASFS